MSKNTLRGLQIVTSFALLMLAIPACDEHSTGSATAFLGDEGRRNDVSVVRGINQDRLASVYDNVDEIDVWVGGLAEDPVNQGLVGELVFTVVKLQFERLRDGDRFWYQRLPDDLLQDVANTRLADIIRRNTNIGNEIPNDVFRAQ